jgi:ATP-binding cassette subfamily C protein LapB
MSTETSRAWLRPFLKPLRPVFREVLAMSAFVNLLALAIPVFTLQVYDRVIGHAGISTLVGFVIGMIFIVAFDYVLRQTRSRIMQTVALRIDVLVGRKLFDQLMALPLSVLEGKPAAYWQSLFRDVDTIRNTLSGATAILVCDLPFAIMFLTLIWVIAAPIAWVLMIILPLFMFIAWRSAAAMSEANSDERQSTQSRDGLVAEMINGRTTVKALALDNAMRPMWEERHADNIANSVARGAKSDLYSNFGGSLTMMTTIFMTTAGSIAIIEGALTMGSLIATNMLSGRLIGPLNQLVGQWRSFNGFKQSVERLGEVFEIEGEREESEVKLNRPDGEIIAENVSYSYAEDLAPVVDQVTIKIKSGGVHALVGRNGSGKTTLLKMLQGLYPPTNGRILLDGADIAQFSRTELANWLGYVPQECVLFEGSVRDNIIHRHPNATDDDIVAAATAAGVHQFIIDLPDGYASEIGEAGRRLSGGQRQRIAIARALLGDPPVVLLDEPSSNLDRQAEQALRKTLVDIGKDRTVVIVTHSPILLAACEDLVALDKGKVALAGPSKEILPKLFGQQPRKDDPAAAIPAAPPPRPQPAPSAPTQAAPTQAAPAQAAPTQAASTHAAPKPIQATPRPATASPRPQSRPPVPSAKRPPSVPPSPPRQTPPTQPLPTAPPPSAIRNAPSGGRPTATAAPPIPQPPTAPGPAATKAKPSAKPKSSAATPKPADKPNTKPASRKKAKTKPPKETPPPSVAADTSVPTENMFSLDETSRHELSDDPYADLIKAASDGDEGNETERKQ